MGLKYCTIPSYYWTDSAFVKHILLHIFVADRSTISPPDPMNHVKIFKGWPLQDAAPKLVQLWYKSFQPGRFCLAEMKKPTMLSNKCSTA